MTVIGRPLAPRCEVARQRSPRARSYAVALAVLLALAGCRAPEPPGSFWDNPAADPEGPPPRDIPTQPDPEVVGETTALAAVASPVRPRALPFYGTDLGWSFPHEGELWVMFGDTWASWLCDSIKPDADDAIGKISLAKFGDGDAVEQWVATHPANRAEPSWHAASPPIAIALDDNNKPEPVRPVPDGKSLTSGPGLTPMVGFSNARSDDASGAFALFLQNEPVRCKAKGVCDDGYECDAQLGQCSPLVDVSAPCLLGSDTCKCVKVGDGYGLCQDRGSSVYDTTERGRTHSVVMRQQVGNARRGSLTDFPSQKWDTRRFYNATAVTVNDFDESRADGVDNDYTPADGVNYEKEGVFVWGRPNFGGVLEEGRDAQLYLAWVPMPEYAEDGHFSWQPRFFAGVDAQGRPRFVEREVDSEPLDLDASRTGIQPEEHQDMVGQMAILWLPSLKRWIMVYGGGIGRGLSELIFGIDLPYLDKDPLGALHVRFAEHPWGPWTRPAPFMISGDLENGIVGQFGPGGILHSGWCEDETCAPGELGFVLEHREWGRLYAPAFVAPWTEERDDGSVDLYWHVSTWNPYQVVLMKTKLRPEDVIAP